MIDCIGTKPPTVLSRLPSEKKNYRLRKNRDFQTVYRQGRYFASPDIVIYCKQQESNQSSRIGFAVVRKTGGAVQRNRLRRRLREVVRLNSSELPLMGCDIIVMARPEAANKTFTELSHTFLILCQRLARWYKEKHTPKENRL